VLPSGSTVNPTQLTVLSMVDQAVPAANGQLSLSASDNGSQIAVVLSPGGNPMLLGWIDSNHPNISASTTAEVLVYFGLAGYLIDAPADRETLIAAIPSAPGFSGLTSAIGAAVAADPDTFAASNASVAAALTAVVGPLLSGASTPASQSVTGKTMSTTALLRQPVKPQSVLVQGGSQSGLEVQPDDPLSAHVVNNTRRRAWAFVSSVSYTIDGTTTSYANDVTNFEVPPEVGLNNGFAGTISDLVNYAYGNTTAAYAPVSAPDPPFAMTPYPSATATTYQVTIVGPGNGATAALSSLPTNQATQLASTAVKGYLVDAFLPFLVNAVAGVNSAQSANLTGTNQDFYSGLATNLSVDFANLLANSPSLYAKIVGGDQIGALNDFLNSAFTSNTYQQLIEAFVIVLPQSLAAAGSTGVVAQSTQGVLTALSSFNRILAAAGVGLQVFDSVVYENSITNANAVENWTLIVAPQPVTISPLTQTVSAGGSVTLTATLPGVSDLTPYSFLWTTTGLAGTLTGVNASQTGVLSYCTSSSSTTYQANTSPNFPIGQSSLQDTVSVQVFQATGANACSTGTPIAQTNGTTSSLPATVTVGETNGCFDQIASIMQAGSTYSLTQTGTLGGLPATKQTNYVARGVVAYSDPPFASSANEQDVTTTYTYPTFPSSNQSSLDIGYDSPPTAANPTSFVTYGANETTTDATGNSAVVNGTFSTPVANWNLMLVTAGSSATLSYAGSETVTQGSTVNSGSFNYTETWKLLGTPTITVQAGTFRTCNFQVTSTLPNSLTQTLWWLYGNGISIQEQDTDSSGNLVDNIQATALTINRVPYPGP
jgi:hypothetical protein